jgi:hypothetical protein
MEAPFDRMLNQQRHDAMGIPQQAADRPMWTRESSQLTTSLPRHICATAA